MEEITRRDFLCRSCKAVGAIAAGSALLPSMLQAKEKPAEKPNFIIILIDDMGWRDVGCYGRKYHETPNIDRLASEGARFTQAYAACPVCSPTRASIMTGKYPARLHLTDWLAGRKPKPFDKFVPPQFNQHLPLEETTFAEALKPAGYITALVGKWHLGGEGFLPQDQGFDVNVGGNHRGSPKSYFYPEWDRNPPIVADPGDYLPDVLTDHAVEFIEKNRNKPFALYLSHYSVHIPLGAKEKLIEKYKARHATDGGLENAVYAAMVQSVDESVGRITQTLDKLGLSKKTMVIFTSDNGGLSVREGANTPATTNAPLRKGKGYLYEGGIREPLIVRWPGKIKPKSVINTPVISCDFLPTMMDAAGVAATSKMDGVSLLPLLTKNKPPTRDALYWHYPHYANQGGRPGGVIRKGDLKLIRFYEDNRLELYDLKKDPGEHNDLAAKMPEVARKLNAELTAWLKSVDAQMPSANPNYDPSAPIPELWQQPAK